ncbi:MAG TPA: isopentenyl phosphate kinase [Thermoplasmata archaeon]
MNRPGLSIVKLGGSVVTRKQREERVRPKVLARLARELRGATGPVVLLHGAGSFGHPGAVRFGLARAPRKGVSEDQRRRGAAIVSAEVRRLHLAVLRELVRAGGRPWSLPPAGVAWNREGRLESIETKPFEETLDAGMTPVAFGDVVPDRVWGHSILSGDTIAVELTRRLAPQRVLFVTDVPGILDPEGGPRPQVVGELTEELVGRLSERTAGPDVTGGIRRKAEAMLEIARLGADAGLISGLTDGALSRALRGEPVFGSWCRAASR